MRIIKGTSVIIAASFAVAVGAYIYNQGQIDKTNKHIHTLNQIQTIFDKLAVNSGTTHILPLIVLKTPMANAWTDGKNITITTGLLNIINGNDDELAMVLGHEMGHVINYDLEHGAMEMILNYQIDNRYKEAAADKMGAYIMMRAGFNECNGYSIMMKFKEAFGDDAGAEGHPDNAFRADQLNLPQCSYHLFGYNITRE